MAEYVNTFTIATLTALLFLGGWKWPTMPFEGLLHTTLSAAWFFMKIYLVILIMFWIRGTYPRLRIDQLMSFGWKLLVPLSFLNIVITSSVVFYGWPLWVLTAISIMILIVVAIVMSKYSGKNMKIKTVTVVPVEVVRQGSTYGNSGQVHK